MFKKLFIAGIFIVILIPASWLGFPYYTAQTVQITVIDKERVPDGDAGSYYLVFTKNEVFKNVDIWRRLKTNSSDLQGALQLGKTFEVNVYGWRIPMLSKYRNIVSIVSEVTPAMVVTGSLPDLNLQVERVRENRLPVAILFPQAFNPKALADALNAQFPDLTIRVFGEENSAIWGLMIYWDSSSGIVLEATPLARDGAEWSLEWGPKQ